MYTATYPIPPLIELASQVVFFAGGPRTEEITDLVEAIADLGQYEQAFLFARYLAYFADGALKLKGGGARERAESTSTEGSGKGTGYEPGQQPPVAPVSS